MEQSVLQKLNEAARWDVWVVKRLCSWLIQATYVILAKLIEADQQTCDGLWQFRESIYVAYLCNGKYELYERGKLYQIKAVEN